MGEKRKKTMLVFIVIIEAVFLIAMIMLVRYIWNIKHADKENDQETEKSAKAPEIRENFGFDTDQVRILMPEDFYSI